MRRTKKVKEKEFRIGDACSALALMLIAGVLVVVILNQVFFSYPIIGEKPAEGIQIAVGQVSDRYLHSGWHARVENVTFDFGEYRLNIGDNVVVVYEWELTFVEDCVSHDGYNPRYVWLPITKKWRYV